MNPCFTGLSHFLEGLLLTGRHLLSQMILPFMLVTNAVWHVYRTGGEASMIQAFIKMFYFVLFSTQYLFTRHHLKTSHMGINVSGV